ncbi:MAG: helix-turn-helix transcriptional regulator [Clostridiales bacterium]|nr:helix-turn-helix transcriptional regulator [Clostridiales bacterium]
MDQRKIGQFIAGERKRLGMTQRQLADILMISDKTVSKWECGGGLPEVSLMLPLCEGLGITVNELLTGERLDMEKYRQKAEENMMELMRQNQENKKKMALSVVCGIITVIAVCALVALAAGMPLPVWARLLLIVLAVVTAVLGIGAACVLDADAGYFECPHCKSLFVPTTAQYVKGYHTLTRRRLTCPECGKTGMCKKRVERQ